MVLRDTEIQRLNPWWTQRGWEVHDAHLQAIRDLGVTIPDPVFVASLDLDEPAVHTIRGPRQVGKSTGLKRLVQRAMAEPGRDPRSVVYLALDPLVDQSFEDVAQSIRRARDLGAFNGAILLLLDEVTVVPHWAQVIKALWDEGTLRKDVVVCTGSSALDHARSSVERLPGRRGDGRDFLVLPQPYARFARVLDRDIPESPGLGLAAICSPEGQQLLKQTYVFLPKLEAAFERYLRFGGLPAALAEAALSEPAPTSRTLRVIWDSMERETMGPGASRGAMLALLERVGRSLGSKTNWSRMAREMDMPLGSRRAKADHRTVKEYIERLARSFSLMVLYFWRTGSHAPDLSREKKVYFGDLLLQSLLAEKIPGFSVDKASAVENALALALYRKYEPADEVCEGFTGPSRLHVYETSRPKEIDFVCGPRSDVELLEVKYQEHVGRADTLTMRRAFPGRPAVLATRSRLYLEDGEVWVPAPLLLWALG